MIRSPIKTPDKPSLENAPTPCVHTTFCATKNVAKIVEILLYQVVPSGQKSEAANLELNKPNMGAEFLEFANKPNMGANKPNMGAHSLKI